MLYSVMVMEPVQAGVVVMRYLVGDVVLELRDGVDGTID